MNFTLSNCPPSEYFQLDHSCFFHEEHQKCIPGCAVWSHARQVASSPTIPVAFCQIKPPQEVACKSLHYRELVLLNSQSEQTDSLVVLTRKKCTASAAILILRQYGEIFVELNTVILLPSLLQELSLRGSKILSTLSKGSYIKVAVHWRKLSG